MKLAQDKVFFIKFLHDWFGMQWKQNDKKNECLCYVLRNREKKTNCINVFPEKDVRKVIIFASLLFFVKENTEKKLFCRLQ